jgi:hypothetical protein
MHNGSAPRLPLLLKIAYTLFLAVLVPFYWINYGPQNFLWFCDIALLVTLPALWLENRLLASMPAVGILLPQLVWIVDFLVKLFTGASFFGTADYMFNPQIPLFVRGLSSFHGWLPFLLVWLVWRLGYDRRALVCQIAVGSLALVLSFVLTERPRSLPRIVAAAQGSLVSEFPGSWLTGLAILEDSWRFLEKPNWAVNVNSVFGRGDTEQKLMSPGLYLAAQVLFYPICFYVPTHFLLMWLTSRRRAAAIRVLHVETCETSDGSRLHRAGQQPG